MLYWSSYTSGSFNYRDWSWVEYNRLSSLYPNNRLFGTQDFTNDILQGMLADCYYMSGIYAIAEDDYRFQRVFVTKEQSKAGIYAINAYVRGKPTIITVDDFVPASGAPIFAGVGTDGALWGPVLEKAWAKVNGNYERTELGMASESLRFLTGCPADYYDLTIYNADSIWEIISNADKSNYIMMAGTTGGSDATTNSYGIANSHAYSLIGAYTVQS